MAFIEVDPKSWDNVSHEVGYQVVLGVKPKRRDWIEEQAENSGWSLDLLGEVKGNSLYISEQGSMPISQIKQKYYNSWEKNFENLV